jgi:glycosyltransferase involved in cell wall biosynthesis
MTEPRFAALVPAYQAAATVGAVVEGIVRVTGFPVLVVDDGSSDDTGAVAAAAGAGVVRQMPNAGKGAALVRGFRRLVEEGFSHAVTVDADGQHLPEEIPALVAGARARPDAIVVGVRQKEGHEIHWVAQVGNVVADTLMTWLAGTPLPDTQSGFRVYPLLATLALGATGTRYDFETEVLFRAVRRDLPLVGVPVRVHYPPVAERVSHFDPVADTLRIIGTVVHVLARG